MHFPNAMAWHVALLEHLHHACAVVMSPILLSPVHATHPVNLDAAPHSEQRGHVIAFTGAP